jgi:hypothetical protein
MSELNPLKPYSAWLDECRRRGIPRTTPPPPGYQTSHEWYRNARGINLGTGQRDLNSFGDWIAERVKRGLPANAPAPDGYESEAEWFRRTRGIEPARGEPLKNPILPEPLVAAASPGVSGFPAGAGGCRHGRNAAWRDRQRGAQRSPDPRGDIDHHPRDCGVNRPRKGKVKILRLGGRS